MTWQNICIKLGQSYQHLVPKSAPRETFPVCAFCAISKNPVLCLPGNDEKIPSPPGDFLSRFQVGYVSFLDGSWELYMSSTQLKVLSVRFFLGVHRAPGVFTSLIFKSKWLSWILTWCNRRCSCGRNPWSKRMTRENFTRFFIRRYIYIDAFRNPAHHRLDVSQNPDK